MENRKPPDDEDVILDLVEEVTPGDEDPEEIVELTDFIEEAVPAPVEIKPADSSLKDVLLFESSPEKDMERDLDCDFVDSIGMDLGTEFDMENGLSAVQIEAVDKPDAAYSGEPEAGTPAVSGIDEERLRTAVERAVEKILSQKLEPILIGAIEKGVAREIEKLKRLLMEDISDHEAE